MLQKKPCFDWLNLPDEKPVPVSLNGSGQCQSNTSVAGGWLDNSVSRLQLPALLGILHHPQGDTVLHGPTSIEELTFSH